MLPAVTEQRRRDTGIGSGPCTARESPLAPAVHRAFECILLRSALRSVFASGCGKATTGRYFQSVASYRCHARIVPSLGHGDLHSSKKRYLVTRYCTLLTRERWRAWYVGSGSDAAEEIDAHGPVTSYMLCEMTIWRVMHLRDNVLAMPSKVQRLFG